MPKSSKKNYDYDLIVLGSGSGGGVAAHIAAGLGKKVAIVEPEEIGGECPNWGCVPTKALLHSAELYHNAKNGKPYGIKADVDFNYKQVKEWKDLAVLRTGTSEGKKLFNSQGIDIIKGWGHFLEPHKISTGKKRYTSKNFLIATGTVNFIPPILGLDKCQYITYREAINLTKLPKSIFVIGGGAIGCEFASLFATFGVKTQIAEIAEHLIPKEDRENGEFISRTFEKDYGIKVLNSAKVVKVQQLSNGKKKVFYKRGYENKSTIVDEILVASGKRANVDIGLENAGVEYTPKSIITDSTMQTSAKHIYAAGDVAGPYMFTHMASYQSKIAAHNMFHRDKKHTDYKAVPRCVFIRPEIANVGVTEQELIDKKMPYSIGFSPVNVIGRSNTEDNPSGFVKVLVNNKDVLVGASIAAPRAGEMIHELTVAIQNGLTAQAVANTIHAFPTWSEAVRLACAKI